MDLGEAVRTRALAVSGLTALVGTRVFWKLRPQSGAGAALPALVIARAGGPPEELDLDDEADSVESRIQFSGLGKTHAEATAIVETATAAFIGAFAEGDFLFWEGEREQPVDLGGDTPEGFVHEIAQDVVVRHSRVI
jgi:hypothetical protein